MAEAAAARGRATRRRLIEAAVALVGEVGWNAVTTRLVAERAGVAPGVVHYHFTSVTDLLVASSVGFAHELIDDLARRLAQQPDLGSGIDWLLAELAGYTGADPASLLIVEMYLASSRIPELRRQLSDMIFGFRRLLAGWLRACGYAGDADAAATIIGAAIDGLVLQHSLDPDLDFAALAAPLRTMLLRKE